MLYPNCVITNCVIKRLKCIVYLPKLVLNFEQYYHNSPYLLTILVLKIWNSQFYYLLMGLEYCYMYGKQCRPWSDAAFCSIWSRSTLFAKAYLSQYLGLLRYYLFMYLKPTQWIVANSVSPEQMPHSVVFDQGQHCCGMSVQILRVSMLYI